MKDNSSKESPTVTTLRGELNAQLYRFAIVASQFNRLITNHLLQGALETLLLHGTPSNQITIVEVPGAFEIPLIAQELAKGGNFHAIITLGAVIRGETPHFDYVSSQAASGVMSGALSSNTPIIFGVLTVDSLEQALQRSGGKGGNKGSEAARSAIEMASLIDQIHRNT
jgi:6,7-dimethyl-8-ribityllumazine synthase